MKWGKRGKAVARGGLEDKHGGLALVERVT